MITRDLQSSSEAPGLQDKIPLADPATDSPQICTADGRRDTQAKPWAVLQVTEVVTYVSRKAVHPDTPLPKIAQQGGIQGPKPPKGRVIVIGAGPAGLAAASHLQVSKMCPFCQVCSHCFVLYRPNESSVGLDLAVLGAHVVESWCQGRGNSTKVQQDLTLISAVTRRLAQVPMMPYPALPDFGCQGSV